LHPTYEWPSAENPRFKNFLPQNLLKAFQDKSENSDMEENLGWECKRDYVEMA